MDGTRKKEQVGGLSGENLLATIGAIRFAVKSFAAETEARLDYLERLARQKSGGAEKKGKRVRKG